jgi:hypothetical protein
MADNSKEITLRDLTADEMKRLKFRNRNRYYNVLKEFAASGKNIMKVETDNPSASYQRLRRAVKDYKFNDVSVKAFERGVVLVKKEYLEKL